MNTKARSGCVACAALLEAVDVFFSSSNNKESSRPPNEELEFRLEFDIRRGQRSLDIYILGTDIALTLSCSKGVLKIDRL